MLWALASPISNFEATGDGRLSAPCDGKLATISEVDFTVAVEVAPFAMLHIRRRQTVQ